MQHEMPLPTTSGNLIVYDQGTVCSTVCGNVSLPQCLFLPAVSYFISAKSFRIFQVDSVLKCSQIHGKGLVAPVPADILWGQGQLAQL